MAQPIHTMILSGGGGRGAFHAGVYSYLCQAVKEGVDSAHQGAWTPDIVVGTSIGAVNGAAIVQGVPAEHLAEAWRGLREQDIQGLPPGMRRFTRWISNLFLRQFIGVKLARVPLEQATSPAPEEAWEPLPVGPRWLSERLVGRWSNLLDTGPLKSSMQDKLGIDLEKISASERTLLITATNVRSGERVMFSNRPVLSRHTGEPRRDVVTGITLERILASCSIPLVYPWTADEETAQVYWDGAVVANTPLSGALDAAQDWPVETPMEAVVVMMTPWVQAGEGAREAASEIPLPRSFSEALTVTLDWALLASFRERLRVTEAYNRLARLERQYAEMGFPLARSDGTAEAGAPGAKRLQYREVNVVVVAPQEFFPMARILDYDERNAQLIELGYQAAESAFRRRFPASLPQGDGTC